MLKAVSISAALFAPVVAEDISRLLEEVNEEYYMEYYSDYYGEYLEEYYTDYYTEYKEPEAGTKEPAEVSTKKPEPKEPEPVVPEEEQAQTAQISAAAMTVEVELTGAFPIGDLAGDELVAFKGGVCMASKETLETVDKTKSPWKYGGTRQMMQGDKGCEWNLAKAAPRNLVKHEAAAPKVATVTFRSVDIYEAALTEAQLKGVQEEAKQATAGDASAALFQAVATTFKKDMKKFLTAAAKEAGVEVDAEALTTTMDALITEDLIAALTATTKTEVGEYNAAKAKKPVPAPEVKAPAKKKEPVIYVHDDTDEYGALIGGIVGGVAALGIGAAAYYYYSKKKAASAAPSGEP